MNKEKKKEEKIPSHLNSFIIDENNWEEFSCSTKTGRGSDERIGNDFLKIPRWLSYCNYQKKGTARRREIPIDEGVKTKAMKKYCNSRITNSFENPRKQERKEEINRILIPMIDGGFAMMIKNENSSVNFHLLFFVIRHSFVYTKFSLKTMHKNLCWTKIRSEWKDTAVMWGFHGW